eukprot:NODE_2865_length_2129_cov_1.493007.p3 GENE.NODE_2865_length_2129_cov_1.493007~~NODE_2865_length_2129_cov_1.493007.p3  ORF type:complete len:216 (-),score=60.19 NODE_2865_length_2129_cov_1.493007:370-1017(-)
MQKPAQWHVEQHGEPTLLGLLDAVWEPPAGLPGARRRQGGGASVGGGSAPIDIAGGSSGRSNAGGLGCGSGGGVSGGSIAGGEVDDCNKKGGHGSCGLGGGAGAARGGLGGASGGGCGGGKSGGGGSVGGGGDGGGGRAGGGRGARISHGGDAENFFVVCTRLDRPAAGLVLLGCGFRGGVALLEQARSYTLGRSYVVAVWCLPSALCGTQITPS